MGHAHTGKWGGNHANVLGSGKTAAYLLPIIDSIYKYKLSIGDGLNTDAPYVLILSPSRELAQQLHEDASAFAIGRPYSCWVLMTFLGTSVKVVAAYGEYQLSANIREIKKGCDVMSATTGRLLHFLETGVLKLDRLQYFILDEADKLLMDKFYDDVVMLNKSSTMV